MAFGFLNYIDQGLTPQNTTTGQAPLDVGALNNQISQSQTQQGQLYGNQSQLAQALLAQSQGQGPNPAQAMLNQQTNKNIQQNAGMIASQKGINPALATRMAAQNAAATSQQAAGQGATMAAQQQLAAQQNLTNVYGQQGQENLSNISTSGQLANQASLGSQQITAGAAAQNAAANQNTNSGILSGIGGAISSFLSEGGEVGYDGGGTILGPATASDQIAKSILAQGGVTSYANGVNLKSPSPSPLSQTKGSPGQMNGLTTTGDLASDMATSGGMMGAGAGDAIGSGAVLAAAKGGAIPPHLAHFARIYHPTFIAKGGSVPADLSPGERYLSPEDAKAVAAGKEDPIKNSKKVPGKAKVSGDSEKNDTVKSMLEPGGFVIKKSIAESKDPSKEATKFVAEKLAQHGQNDGKSNQDDFKDALKKAISSRRGK